MEEVTNESICHQSSFQTQSLFQTLFSSFFYLKYNFSTYKPSESPGTSRQAFQLSKEQIKLVSGSERPKRPSPPKLKFTRAGNLSTLMEHLFSSDDSVFGKNFSAKIYMYPVYIFLQDKISDNFHAVGKDSPFLFNF